MAKLTKEQTRRHNEAVTLLQKDVLTDDERIFVLENWREDANHNTSVAGAFFTPSGLANDFAMDAGGGRRVLDLCAGIGGLGFWLKLQGRVKELVCVEINPAYIEVGKKILPDATWIQADVFDLPELGQFCLVISNPPFGSTPRRGGKSKLYSGSSFEYHVIAIASELADRGAFIVPQGSAPFTYSGSQHYREKHPDAYARFSDATGITLEAGCGIDTGYYRDEWHGTSPLTEVVHADFEEVRKARLLGTSEDLFAHALAA